MEGAWRDRYWTRGQDSAAVPRTHDKNQKSAEAVRLLLAQVTDVQAEPEYKQHSVVVEFIRGGQLGFVGWPGPHVAVDQNGSPSPSPAGIHGLFEAPLAGQQVLVGFVEGDTCSPVVVQKYGYNPSQDPAIETAYFLPMLSQAHGERDVVLGSFTGCYIALRGTFPLPGEIDISSPTTITMVAGANIDQQATNGYNVRGAQVLIEAQGTLDLKATPSVVVNSGSRPVAANGDMTLTSLGPMPITATGTAVLVP